MNFFVLNAESVVIATMTSNMEQPDALLIDDAVLFADGQARTGRCRYVDGDLIDFEPQPEPPAMPLEVALSDWRIGLRLWKVDGVARFNDVVQRIAGLIEARHPLGEIAHERFEYANRVLRSELVQLADAFGFDEAEIDESLWRADRVRQRDLTGVWPLPAD